jgi:hypothetical protein
MLRPGQCHYELKEHRWTPSQQEMPVQWQEEHEFDLWAALAL